MTGGRAGCCGCGRRQGCCWWAATWWRLYGARPPRRPRVYLVGFEGDSLAGWSVPLSAEVRSPARCGLVERGAERRRHRRLPGGGGRGRQRWGGGVDGRGRAGVRRAAARVGVGAGRRRPGRRRHRPAAGRRADAGVALAETGRLPAERWATCAASCPRWTAWGGVDGPVGARRRRGAAGCRGAPGGRRVTGTPPRPRGDRRRAVPGAGEPPPG